MLFIAKYDLLFNPKERETRRKIKMKCTAVFVILSCLFASAAFAKQVTTWGEVNGQEIGFQHVIVPSTIFQVKTYEFTFPKVYKFITSFSIFLLNKNASHERVNFFF